MQKIFNFLIILVGTFFTGIFINESCLGNLGENDIRAVLRTSDMRSNEKLGIYLDSFSNFIDEDDEEFSELIGLSNKFEWIKAILKKEIQFPTVYSWDILSMRSKQAVLDQLNKLLANFGCTGFTKDSYSNLLKFDFSDYSETIVSSYFQKKTYYPNRKESAKRSAYLQFIKCSDTEITLPLLARVVITLYLFDYQEEIVDLYGYWENYQYMDFNEYDCKVQKVYERLCNMRNHLFEYPSWKPDKKAWPIGQGKCRDAYSCDNGDNDADNDAYNDNADL